MKSLDELPALLEQLTSQQKEKKSRTFVVRYKDKNIVMKSGKSYWKALNHAKAAVLNHFSHQMRLYSYPPTEKYTDPYGVVRQNFDYSKAKERKEEFKQKLYSLVEFIELEN
jgi:hypothetical protein